jgi:non-ribosomal peptide synthetase component F
MTLLAAFQTLLHRHTGQEDIVVGTSIANRTSLETEQLLGCFFNQLALRTDLSGEPTFRQLLGRVRETTLAAYAHQDVPFEKVLESVQPGRGQNSSPLFQVFFVLQNAPAEPPRMTGLTLSTLELPTSSAKFDLALMMEEGAEGLRGVLDYGTDLFDAASAGRLLGRFRALLEDVVRRPDEGLPRLSMGEGEGARQSIDDFNDDLKE